MKRELTTEEARDEKLAELTKANLEARWALLKVGDPRTVTDVCNSVLDYLACSKDWSELIKAVANERPVSGRFLTIVRSVMLGEAELDAMRDMEQLEQKASGDQLNPGHDQ